MLHFIYVMILISVPFLSLATVFWSAYLSSQWTRDRWYGIAVIVMALAAYLMFKASQAYGPDLPGNLSSLVWFQCFLAASFVVNWWMHVGLVFHRR